ncbi:MAG: hypothetical protein P8107_04425 [Spirochaetia bacterium]
MRTVLCCLLFVSFLSGAALYAQPANTTQPPNAPEQKSVAETKLDQAQELYTNGKYEACDTLIDETITAMEQNQIPSSNSVLASLYIVKSFVVYAFREKGYQDKIEKLLRKAIETNIFYDFPDPRVVPLYILEEYRRIKTEYLAQFMKTTRRNVIGLYGSLVMQPTVLKNPAVIQPGIHYAFNLDNSWSLWLNIAIPTQIPLLESIQGTIGVTWFPTFKVETICLGLSAAYSFRLEHYESYAHSVLLEGYGEIIYRSGLGFGASVELMRFDLLFGTGGLELPEYGYIDLFPNSSLRLAFANLHLYLFYTF